MNIKTKIGIISLIILLVLSLGVNFYCIFFYDNFCSYLQDTNEIYIMESGIIEANLEFREGNDITFTYDFDNTEYDKLLKRYDIKKIAGSGSEFDKAVNLMHEYSERLSHSTVCDMEPEQMNAEYLLDYALDEHEHGINCRAKAQILYEMCLALGIYSRKLWLMPISSYDTDCHVVNEIWDIELNKWIMLDITNDMYWVDENGIPLSVIEIREKLAKQEFCTPVDSKDNHSDLKNVLDDNYDIFMYIAKNMVYIRYMAESTVGEKKVYDLMPKNLGKLYDSLISEVSVKAAPEVNKF